MPLPKRLFLTSLIAILAGSFQAGTAVAADNLNWVDREDMRALPPVYQRPIPLWCSGIYYNPGIGVPSENSDTIVTADHTSITQGGLIRMDGDVLIEKPGRRLSTQSATLDQSSGKFQIDSPLRLEGNQFTFLADGMSGQTTRGQASLYNVRYSLFGPQAHGTARYLDRINQFTTITRGTYTTCPPGHEGWLLRGRKIRIDEREGWGTARDVTLEIHNVPVFWLPWMTFPINDKRKTGLLFPTISSGDNGGLDITQPIYINIHPQMDATISPRYIDGRGAGLDTQFRYLTHYGHGEIDYGILFHDRKFHDENRELASWQHDGSVGRWAFTADVNYVSDPFYFKDLSTGLDVTSKTHLPRLGEVRYYGKEWFFLARLQSWQTIDPTLSDANLPYRRLPQLHLSGSPHIWGPVSATLVSDFTIFDRSDEGNVSYPTGMRTHLQPGLVAGWSRSWGYVRPSARLYYNQYQLDNAGASGSNPSMKTWGATLDSGLFFERDTFLFGRQYIQTLEPRLFINKVAYTDQHQLPDFDAGDRTFSYNTLFRKNRFVGYDRIGDEEKIALGITSRFLRDADGSEQLRLRLGQGFYADTRRVQLNGEPPDDSAQTPLVADMRWNFGQDWYLYSEGQWDTDINQRQRSTLRIGYNDDNRRIFNIGFHDRPADDLRESEIAAIWPISNHWRLIGRWLYDVEHNRSMETLAGAEWRNCCWKIRLISQRGLTDEDGDGTVEADSTIMLQIQLTGLGGFGGRIDSLLERSIPGYRSNYD